MRDPAQQSKTMLRFWACARAGEGYLYLAERGNHIKIGFSLNPERRCHGMGHKMLASMPGTLAQEKALHQSLRSLSIKDETYPRSVIKHPALPEGLRPGPAEDDQYDPALLAVGIRAPKVKRPHQLGPAGRIKRAKRIAKYAASQRTTKGIARSQAKFEGAGRAAVIVFRG